MQVWPASLLHDAVLVSAELKFERGLARLWLTPHESYADQPRLIEARGLKHADFPRREEWGPSSSVLEARAPEQTPEGHLRLTLVMQSGDEMTLVADEILLDPEWDDGRDTEGPEAFRQFTAALSVYSHELSLTDIVALLGEPSDGGNKGDRRRAGAVLRHTFWSKKSAPGPLDTQIAEAAAFVEVHRDAIASLRPACTMRIFCGVFTAYERNCGFELNEALLERLGALDIPVDVDVL